MRAPIPSLTGLRFVAAMCVVSRHAIPKMIPLEDTPGWLHALTETSAIGMTLFFVLSGFVIYYNYSESIRRPAGLYNFFVARFARLYPLYFLALALEFVRYVSASNLSVAKTALPFYLMLTQSWLYLPTGEDRVLAYSFGPISGIAWSVSTEWFFYLFFPLALVAILSLTTIRRTLWAGATLIIIAFAISVTLIVNAPAILAFGLDTFGPIGADPQGSFYRWLVYFSPYMRVFEFLLGCLCASIHVKLDAPSVAEERIGAWLTAGAIAAIAVLHWLMFGVTSDATWHRILLGLHMNFGFAPMAAVLIFCCARYRTALSRLLSGRLVVLAGEASYSLYLLHLIIIAKFSAGLPLIISPQTALGAIVHLALVVATSVGLSLVTWALIEVPARRWIRRVMTIRTPTASAKTTPAPIAVDR